MNVSKDKNDIDQARLNIVELGQDFGKRGLDYFDSLNLENIGVESYSEKYFSLVGNREIEKGLSVEYRLGKWDGAVSFTTFGVTFISELSNYQFQNVFTRRGVKIDQMGIINPQSLEHMNHGQKMLECLIETHHALFP